QQGDAGPSEPASRAGGILGGEVGGRREDRALDVRGLEAVGLLEGREQLFGRLENRVTRVRGRGGRAPQAAQDLGHGTRRTVAFDGDHGPHPARGPRYDRCLSRRGQWGRDYVTGPLERWLTERGAAVDPVPRGGFAGARPRERSRRYRARGQCRRRPSGLGGSAARGAAAPYACRLPAGHLRRNTGRSGAGGRVVGGLLEYRSVLRYTEQVRCRRSAGTGWLRFTRAPSA